MKWMQHKSRNSSTASKISKMLCIRRASSFVLVLVGFSAIFSSVASAQQTSVTTYWSTGDSAAIQEINQNIQAIQSLINGVVDDVEAIRGLQLSRPVQYAMQDDLANLLIIVSNALKRSGGTFGGGSGDLNANPWWYTNSNFSLLRSNFAQPQESNSSYTRVDFPQFLSWWSSELGSMNQSQPGNWFNLWGSGQHNTAQQWQYYTWFDWMADAMRSNIVLQGRGSDRMQSSLDSFTSTNTLLQLNLANRVLPQYFNFLISSNMMSSADIVSAVNNLTNYLHLSGVGGGSSVLAGNPWWSTNSAFALRWDDWTSIPSPFEGSPEGYSFPTVFSLFVSSLTRNRDAGSWWSDVWGRLGQNGDFGLLTWYDWMADAMRSNITLQSSIGKTSDVARLSLLYALRDFALTNSLDIRNFENHFDSFAEDSVSVQTNLLASVSNFSFVVSNILSELSTFSSSPENELFVSNTLASVQGVASTGLVEAADAEDDARQSFSDLSDSANSLSDLIDTALDFSNPYALLSDGISDFSDRLTDNVLPDFDTLSTDPVLVIFDANSGLSDLDHAGSIRINLAEEYSTLANTAGNVFEWAWGIVNAASSLMIVFRFWGRIHEAV